MIRPGVAEFELTAEQVSRFHEQGYVIVGGIFDAARVAALKACFDRIAERGASIPGHWELDAAKIATGDPLARYPRVMQPHRFEDVARQALLEPAVGRALKQLLAEPAVACQSMFYFKPPGARGQALHQDNFYLEVMPGTCIAAWTAIDDVDPENGGLMVVPGTQTMDVLCPDQADLNHSFTTHLVNPPKGMKAVPAAMQAGDVLFFNGSLIHGSGPNRSATRWRRSFICHYMPASSRSISRGYFPVLDFAGNEVDYDKSTGGGPCGYEADVKKPTTYH